MRADHEALQALLQSDQPDATKVGTAMLKVQANRNAARAQMTSSVASVRAVLTPEQAFARAAGRRPRSKGYEVPLGCALRLTGISADG